MSKYFFLVFVYLLLLFHQILCKNTTDYFFPNLRKESVRAVANRGHVSHRLRDVPLYEENEQQLLDLTSDSIEQALAEAAHDIDSGSSTQTELHRSRDVDAYVPQSLDNSFVHLTNNDDFEHVKASLSSLSSSGVQTLKRVPYGDLPAGIITKRYSHLDQTRLRMLFRSDQKEDIKELFEFIAKNIHRKYENCATNFFKWIKNPRSEMPLFYQNCIPCTNAVDLNLKSFHDEHTSMERLKHYFVNTCEMGTQWISYIHDMIDVSIDFQRHPSTTFTEVIRQGLLPNSRYVVQGLVRYDKQKKDSVGFRHVCNLINDQIGHPWIIDGQTERVFDLDQAEDVAELDQRYRPDYVARALTGKFRPPLFN